MSPTDPVCGTPVDIAASKTAVQGSKTEYFCSDFCRAERLADSALVREAKAARRIAYFSMEVLVDSAVPTYAGGLGVLAGDTLLSCADLGVPVIGITLLHRKGYFAQRLDASGHQSAEPAQWSPERHLSRLEPSVDLQLERRTVRIRAWKKELVGASGYIVPVLFLDTDQPENTEEDRRITDSLYGGDDRDRLRQEAVLGVGGVRMLAALGYDGVRTLHLNEGHASLAALELLRRQAANGGGWDNHVVRERCVFTTHTPVPAGHDQFPYSLVERVLDGYAPHDVLARFGGEDRLNMTRLAFELSHRVNGVAARHQEVSKALFPGRDIHHITNGVHPVTWTCDALRALFDRFIPGWREDPSLLRKALAIPREEVWGAHATAKTALLHRVREKAGVALRPDALTIGFARRSTPYKRPELIFRDVERLRTLGRERIQLVFAGKAHPRDDGGQALIRRIFEMARGLGRDVPVAYLEDYDATLARHLVAGVDVWLNTPLPPLEASGTSGMKAALNGVPSLSVLDGWWVEGWVEGITGWAIGRDHNGTAVPRDQLDAEHADDLYLKLETVVLPLYLENRERWIDVMRHAIGLNGSFFNSHRMVQQYVTNAYLP